MNNDTRLPVALLTGFLGAGKSTLLNFLLRHPQMTGTAVVINEYGSVGIDHHLVESAPDDTALVEGGCLCCTAQGQLADALLSLFTRAQQRQFSMKRLVIETTGLAEPGPIIQQLLSHPRLDERFVLDSVTTLVDAFNAEDTLAGQGIAVSQVTSADRLLLTKTDLVSAEHAAALEQRLAQMNPDAIIERVLAGAARPEQLFSGGRHNPESAHYSLGNWFESAGEIRLSPLTAERQALFGEAAQARMPQDIQTFSLILDQPLRPSTLFGWLELLRSLCGPTLLRMKGLVHVEGQRGPAIIHGVQKVFHPVRYLEAWPSEDQRTRLVVITRGWAKELIASTLGYLESRPAETSGEPART